jgi:hypothetical protein
VWHFFLIPEVGEVDSFLGQDPPTSSSSIIGLSHPLSSANTDSKPFTTLFSDLPQPSGLQESFEEAYNLQAQPQPQPPQGYAPQPFSVPHPQPISVTHPLQLTSSSSYARSSSPVLQIAPISSTASQVLPPSLPRADQSSPIQWSLQSPPHDVIGTTLLHNIPDPVHSSSDTTGHQAAPLFQTSASSTSSSLSQLQHGYELQSSSSTSTVPLLAPSQYQQYQPLVKQEGSIPLSAPISFPPVSAVAPSGKF